MGHGRSWDDHNGFEASFPSCSLPLDLQMSLKKQEVKLLGFYFN